MPELPAILDAIRERPDDGTRWQALASWLWDNRRDDEAAAVRAFWPVFQGNLPAASPDATLDDVARNARLLTGAAMEAQERAAGDPNDKWQTE